MSPKLWVANKIIRFFYSILEWSFKVKMEAEHKEEIMFEFVPVNEGKIDRKSMN